MVEKRCKSARGCLGTIDVEEDEEIADHCCAAFIVKWPCCCCWLSVVVALFFSIFGWVVMISVNSGNAAGPMRSGEGGLDYPITSNIAKQMDALYLSSQDSERDYANLYRGGRRLADPAEAPTEVEPTSWFELKPEDFSVLKYLPERAGRDAALELLRIAAERGRNAHDAALKPPSNSSHKRSLQSGGPAVQSEVLFPALFVFDHRSDGNVFSDPALAELCALQGTMTSDMQTVSRQGQSYHGYRDFCEKPPSMGVNGAVPPCYSGLSPLVFFYGDASYDIDTYDLLTPTSSPNFNHIVALVSNGQTNTSIATYGVTETTAVLNVFQKLLSWMLNAWFNSPILAGAPGLGCQPSMKKNTAAVLNNLAIIRDNTALNSIFGAGINYYFDAGFSRANPISVYTRGMFNYGAPQKGGYLDASDRDTEQEDNWKAWFWSTAELQNSYDENDSGLWNHVRPTGLIPPLLLQILLDLLIRDGLMAIAPLVLVYLIVWFQTRSYFIAFVTIVECTLSFTASVFVLICVGIQWMAFEQFLAIYIVLAIGADDVFVFMDAYKQSFYLGPKVNESLTKRMSWVYRRAGLAMLITSLTTASAFVATAISSPIPTLAVFGIFAAAVIILDYCLVMTFLCSCVVVYHNWFENKGAPCCVCCTCAAPGSSLDWWLCHASKYGGCTEFCKCCQMKTTTEIAREGGPETEEGAKPLYVRLFEDIFPFETIIKNPISRGISIVIFLALLIPFAIRAAEIEPKTSAENFLPESHPFQRFITAQTMFLSSREDTTVEEQIVYGFNPSDPIDLAGVNRLQNPDNWGTPKHTSTFVLDEAAQQAILADCALLRASDIVQSRFQQTSQTTFKAVFCWMEAFEAYRTCVNQPFPVPTDGGPAVLTWISQGPQHNCPDTAFPYGRSNTPEGIEQSKFDFEKDLGWVPDSGVQGGLRVAWTRVRANTLLRERAYLPAKTLRTHYDGWEALTATLNTGAPTSLGPAMHISSQLFDNGANKWLHMVLQETYVRMAFSGLGMGLVIAFVVLLLATMNFIVSVLSMVTIICALACVIGQVVMRGWQLGSAESMSVMILTGFAVDYVVHLSHAYMESNKADRIERVHDALRDLGISVFWGMLTSIISAFVLSSLQLQFFAKFGFFFLLTIIWAYLWSVLFLMPMLAFIGPKGVGPNAVDKGTAEKPAPMGDGVQVTSTTA